MANVKLGIDCYSPISSLVAPALVKEGYTFVCRYMIPTGISRKRLTPAEVKILTNNKLMILSVYETSANRPAGGAVNGTADGKAAFAEAKLLGMPTSGCIYFAVDYDAQPAEFDTVEAYLNAAKKQIGDYKIGVYGSFKVVEALYARKTCDCYWQAYAWSNKQLSTKANVYQYSYEQKVAGINVDLNKAFGNEGFWNLSTAKSKTWKEILPLVSTSHVKWVTAIERAITAAKQTDLAGFDILQYLGELIEKVYALKYTTPLNWTEILNNVSPSNANEWKIAIDAIASAAKAPGDLGAFEIFTYFPELLVRIHQVKK